MATLEELKNKAVESITYAFAKFGEVKAPTWICETDTGGYGIFSTEMPGSGHGKDLVIEKVKELFKEKQVCRYILAMEMWFVAHDMTGLNPEQAKAVTEFVDSLPPPSQRTDRKEGVLFIGEDRDTGETVNAMFTIDRSGTTPVLTLSNLFDKCTAFDGRFTNLFDRPAPVKH